MNDEKGDEPQPLLSNITQIVAAVPDTVCVLDHDGQVFCWGDWTRSDQRNEAFVVPQRVVDLPPMRQLAPFSMALGVSRENQLFEWELDPKAPLLRARPLEMQLPNDAQLRPDGRLQSVALEAIPAESQQGELLAIVQAMYSDDPDIQFCSIETSGRVHCAELWPPRPGGEGQVLRLPGRVASVGGDGSGGNFIAVLKDGRSAIWGSKLEVELRDTPRLNQASRMSGHNCGVDSNGTVHCWWDTRNIPTISTQEHSSPKVVEDAGPAQAVIALREGGCALQRSGTVKCWGDNDYGQCGIGARGPSVAKPTSVLAPRKDDLGPATRRTDAYRDGTLTRWKSAASRPRPFRFHGSDSVCVTTHHGSRIASAIITNRSAICVPTPWATSPNVLRTDRGRGGQPVGQRPASGRAMSHAATPQPRSHRAKKPAVGCAAWAQASHSNSNTRARPARSCALPQGHRGPL